MGDPIRFAMTREETRRMLTARADAASTLISDCTAYVDTISVLLQKPLELSRLRRDNHGQIIPYASKVRHAACGYRIHRPTQRTIDYISTERPNHLVTRFDLALDFIVASANADLLLAEFFRQHLTQPWRGKRHRTVYEGTIYLGPASTRRNTALYVSPSKITGQPAVHLEMRYIRAGTCRRRGVHRVGDLSALDIDACIRRDIRFSTICWRIADRAIDQLAAGVARKHADRAETVKTPRSIYDRRISVELARCRLVHLFLRSMADENREVHWCDRGEFAAQDCIDGWRVLRDAAVHVPPSALIKRQPLLIFP